MYRESEKLRTDDIPAENKSLPSLMSELLL